MVAQAIRSMTLVGYFDTSGAKEPAFDPGLDVPDIVCWKPLRDKPRVTVSLAWLDGDRSYFFRSHKECWEGLSSSEQQRYEESALGRMTHPASGDHPFTSEKPRP